MADPTVEEALDWAQRSVEPIVRVLAAEVVRLRDGQVCGACGKPWDGIKCGQHENGWPYPTCYPIGAAA